MSEQDLINLSAILALLPITIVGINGNTKKNSLFWVLLLVATLGPVVAIMVNLSGGWYTDLKTSILATMAVTMSLFTILCINSDQTWRLAPLVSGYTLILGISTLIWNEDKSQVAIDFIFFTPWLGIHIIVSLITYGFITIGAIASCSAAYQEYALKQKKKKPLANFLPSVQSCDKLVILLLVTSEVILAIGLISGTMLEYTKHQQIFELNHKTLFSILLLVLVCNVILQFQHQLSGYLVIQQEKRLLFSVLKLLHHKILTSIYFLLQLL